MKTFNFFEKLWEHSRTLRRVGMVLALCLITITQMWAVNSTFTKGETIFFYSEGTSSAWRDGACVKADFSNNGSSTTQVTTAWLCDATDNANYKVFWAIVPSTGKNRVHLHRYASNCSTNWNLDGNDINQSSRSKDSYNVIYSAAYNNSGWKNETFAFKLKTDKNSWGDPVATFEDKGDGFFQCSYTFTAGAASHKFKVLDSWGHWYGQLSDGNDYVLSGLTKGTQYTIVASFNIQDCSSANKTSLTVQIVHEPGLYNSYLTDVSGVNYERFVFSGSSSPYLLGVGSAAANTSAGNYVLSFTKAGPTHYQWISNESGVQGVSSGNKTIASSEFTFASSITYLNMQNNQKFSFAVKGYDQFSMFAHDNNTSDKIFKVYVNGEDKTTGTANSDTRRTYTLDKTKISVITVKAIGAQNSNFFSFAFKPSKPTITASTLTGATYDQGDTPSNLSVTASPVVTGATVTYQWFSNTTAVARGGSAVDGATNATFAPPTDADAVGTNYYYCVVSEAGCNSDTTSISGAIVVNAGGCTDVAAPTGLTCSAQTKNTLTFSWTAAPNASGYEAKLWSNSECSGEALKTQSLGDVNSVTFNSLSAGTNYYCKVQSKGDGETYCESGGTTSAQSGTTKTVHSISFNVNGGSGSLTTISDIEYGSSQKLTAIGSNITRSGWTFTGWNTNKYGTGTPYADQATVASVTSNITLYAQWEKTVYLYSEIGWWYNGGAWYAIYYWDNSATSNYGYVTMELADCEEKVYKATLPGNGYTHLRFLRMNPNYDTPSITTGMWNKTEDYAYPTSNPLFTINATDAVTCTGSWGTYSEPKYTITFASNGADGGTAMTNVTNIACEGDVDLVANTWTKSGNTFANWKTNVAITADGSAVAANGAVADEASITDITSNITLTAQWTPNNYDVAAHTLSNVTLSSGGSTGTGVATWGTNYTATFAAADGYTLPASITVTIGGNSTTAGTEYTWTQGTGTVVVNGAYITGNVAITVAGIIKKTVTYKKNGGASGADGSVTGSTTDASSPYAHGSTVTTKASGFANSGYKFKWWNTAYDGSGEDFYVGEKFNITANTNLFAQWEEVASGQAFWVGDVAISDANTAYDVAGNSATMQIKRETNADWNSDISKDWNQVSKYSGTAKKAKVLAVDNNDSYIEVNFKDGSAINALELGVCNKDGNDNEMVVIYSTTADFSSGVGEKVAKNTKKFDQSTKAVYDVSPSTPDLYKYARIYRRVTTAVYGLTGGSDHIIRIYSIKAEKGAACESLDAPEGLSCTTQTKNSLTFGWSAVTYASSYDVYLYSDADCTAEVTPTEGKPYNVTGTSATLTGLDGGTTYYCKVRTKGDGSTYCTNGGITTTAANGKTKYGVTYAGNSQTSGSVPTDANGYASGDEVTVLGKNTLAKTGYTFRGWTCGDFFYKEGDKFNMPDDNVTLTAVWDSEASGESCTTFTGSSAAATYVTTHWTMYGIDSNGRYSSTNRWYADQSGCNGSAYSFQGDKRFLLKFDEDVVGIHFHAYNGSARTVDGISITTTEPVSGKTASYTNLSSSTDYSCTKTGTTGCQEFEIEFSSAITAGTWIWVKMSDAVVIQEMCYSTSGSGEGWANKYVAFDNNAGVVGTPSLPDTIKGVPSGKKIVQPADPTATGYIFDNWYPTQACNTAAFNWSGTITKDTTIYAKFNTPTTLIEQPAKIAGKRVPIDTLDAKNHPEIDSVIVHQLISPTPYGTCNITYQLGYAASHTLLDVQPKIRMGKGAGVGYDTIWMPMNETMVYEIVAYLRNSADSAAGDLVTTDTALVSVEKTWPIKVRYVMDGVELRDPTEWPVYPSYRTTEIRVMKEQQGYVFDSLEYGVGITVDSVKANWSSMAYATYVKAANASTITAHYKVPDTTVYFFNTFDKYWYSTRVWKYEYGADGYWNGSTGSGADGLTGDSMKISSYDDENRDKLKVHLTSGKTKMSFTSRKMDGSNHFWGTKSPNEIPHVIYRDDYNDALKMFVPVSTNEDEDYITMNKTATGEAHYYRGFWVRRSPDRDSTGYFLHVFDKVDQATASHIQSLPLRLTQSGANDTWELTATMDLEGGKTYGFKITKANTGGTIWLSNSGTMTSADHTGWVLDGTSNNIGLTTTGAGNYTFHVFCKAVTPANPSAVTAAEIQGKLAVTVDYATLDGDFRVVYQDDSQIDLTDNSGVEPIASQSIRARANGQDTVTFFIRKDATNRSMKFQKFNGSTGAWDDVASGTIDLTNTAAQTFTVSTDTTYQIYLQQNADGTGISATGMDYYSGLYYIRTDCVDEHKWDYMQSPEAHRMVESDYASHLSTDPFTHYFVHWVDKNKNVKFVVATQYSPTLTDTLITDTYANVAGGNLPAAGASVRFMYHKKTNWIKRAYLAGAQGGALDPDFLKLSETSSGKMKNTSGSAISSITFSDLGNFTYQAEIKAQPGLAGKLTAEYNSNTQYFRGTAMAGETILGGSGSGWQNIVMTYDFKTNRLICAWTPSGDSIDGDMAINADIMIIRKGQDDAQQIVFKTNESKLSSVKYIYGVIQLDYNDLVGMMPTWDWWSYGHCMYYISFPFDVLVSDITGVGTIGQEWRLQRYNGAKRAEKGWFIDGEKTFWEDLHAGDTLKAYEGYSLLLNRTRFNSASSAIWENKSRGSSVYLFFPSMNASTGIVADGSVTVHVPAHECTKDQTFINSHGMLVNHKVTDSHWNMLGTPIFADTTAFSMDEGPRIDGEYSPLQYVYAWNHYGNTLGIQLTLTTKWKFKAMYSYMVQYAGDVVFKGSTVSKIVAAHRNSEKKNYHVNLELTKDEQFIGRTYVQLRENAVDSFLLNEDIYMVRNGVNADLFTYAGGYEAGANVLPIADQTVQVGVAVKKAGTYVFSMPDDFDGEVTLVDTYAQTRTNLAIEDYEIALPTGEITDRFYLEININKMPTAIDGVDANQGALKDGKAHKFIENDMMYILKDGVLYDARGNRVK